MSTAVLVQSPKSFHSDVIGTINRTRGGICAQLEEKTMAMDRRKSGCFVLDGTAASLTSTSFNAQVDEDIDLDQWETGFILRGIAIHGSGS